MRIISWNIQGVKKSQVLQEIMFLKRTHKPHIIFLLEALVNKNNILDILPKMGFEHLDYVDPVNHSGGLVVLLNNGIVCALVLRKEQRAIHKLVHDTEKKKCNLVVSCVYAPAQQRDKDYF